MKIILYIPPYFIVLSAWAVTIATVRAVSRHAYDDNSDYSKEKIRAKHYL